MFHVICYELYYFSIFVNFVTNFQGVLYVLGCACVSLVFYVCVYMCILTMCVCLEGFAVFTYCSMWFVMSYFTFLFSSGRSVCSGLCMCVCSFLRIHVHVYVNNVRLFGGFCCVNALFYLIIYVLSYVYIFISCVSNL